MSKDHITSESSGTERDVIAISVIVPFHNSARHLESCISALLSQTYPSPAYEIIMIDNNSTDGSSELVRRYSEIKLLSEMKNGSYAARNRGVAESKGDIIAFTDSDCVPSPEWLDRISRALGMPGVGIIQGGRLYNTGSPGLLLLQAYESERAAYTFSGKSSGLYYGYTNNMAVRREVFERCGPFVEIMRGADSIFVNRVIGEYSPDAVRYVPEALIRHSEITGVSDYLRKRFIYGRSLELNFSIRRKNHRKMGIRERYGIIKSTAKRNDYSLSKSLHLAILILAGMVCFMSGRQSVRFQRMFNEVRGVLGRKLAP